MLNKVLKTFGVVACVAFMFVACKGNGTTGQGDSSKDKNKPTPQTKEIVAIEFEATTMSCKNGKDAFESGKTVEDGTELDFVAIKPQGKKVKEWKANDELLAGEKNEKLKYKVDAKKAKEKNKKKVITISVTFEDEGGSGGGGTQTDYSIKFDSAKMDGKKKATNDSISDGYMAKEGEEIIFTLKDANAQVESWIVAGKDIENTASTTFNYTVKKDDADASGNIAISFKLKGEKKIFIKFDSAKMSAQLKGVAIQPNAEVAVGDKVSFQAMVARGKKLKNWTLNEVERSDFKGAYIMYTVAQADVKENAITIDYATDNLKSFVIDFNSAKIECKLNNTEKTPIQKGDVAYNGEILKFEAVNLADGEIIKLWQVKGKDASLTIGSKTFAYTVKEEDAELVGDKQTIKVGFSLQEVVTIQYGNEIEKCVIPGAWFSSTPVPNNGKVADGAWLTFTAKVEAGHAVEEWRANDVPIPNEKKNTLSYQAKKENATGGIIKISAKVVELNSATLKYDKTRIKCKKNYRLFNPDQVIYAGEKLEFQALIKEGWSVVKWKINNVEKSEFTAKKIEYTFNIADAVDNAGNKEITFDYTDVENPKHHIVFEESKIEAKKTNADPVEAVANNAEVQEGVSLTFKAKLQNGEAIKEWTIGGSPVANNTSSTLIYVVNKDNATVESGNSNIKIAYTLKKKLTIKFDSNKMTCKKPDGWSTKPVETDSTEEEGTRLTFTAKGIEDNKKIEAWSINGVDKTDATANTFVYTVNVADGASAGNVITIDYKTKEKGKFYIHFDKNKMDCKKGSDPVESDMVELPEGTKLKFTTNVIAAGVKEWRVKDVVQPRWGGYAYFDYTVKASDAEEISGKQAIKVEMKEKEKVKIVFASNIECNHNTWTSSAKILSGDLIYEGSMIKFTAKLQEGQKVVAWKKNGTIIAGATSDVYRYNSVLLTDAKDNAGQKEIEFSVDIQ